MTPRLILIPLLLSIALSGVDAALAQDKGSVDPKPLPPLANPGDPKLAAKELFARKLLPSAAPTRVIGFYSKGCIAGAVQMPVNGETWQGMRLSRNRNWGHPDLIALLKRLSIKGRKDAQEPSVQRIFVNPAIKKALCRDARGDRSWLSKVRPWWGHDYHFHIRTVCPPGSGDCKP